MFDFLKGAVVVLVLSSCGSVARMGAANECKFFDTRGLTVRDLEMAFSEPAQDAEADFRSGELRFAVVRNKYGRTVTPLVESLDPVYQEQTEGDDTSKKIWSRLTDRVNQGYTFLFLQSDVKTKGPQSEVNFHNVENPCFDQAVYDYGGAYNTHMLRLAYKKFSMPVDF